MMKHISILSAILSTVSLPAEEIPASPVSPAAVTRWQDARFGMFIHWEPVSLKGTEIGWSRGDQIPIDNTTTFTSSSIQSNATPTHGLRLPKPPE